MKRSLVASRWLLVLLAITGAWPCGASAESLSDLNVQDFQQKKPEAMTGTAKSPFLPQRAAKEELLVQDLRLTGVAITTGESYALVSGTLVRVGDRLAGYRVSSIERTRIVLRKLDETFMLQMEGAM